MKEVKHIKINKDMKVNELVKAMQDSGVMQAGKLALAVNILEEMIKDNPSITFEKSLIRQFVNLYLEEWDLDVLYFPEIKNFIKKLSSQYKLGIITNTHFPSLIHNHLKNMEIQNYFQTVVTSVEFGLRKPNKDIFLYGAKQLNIKPPHILFVGDSYKDDYEGALSAQMGGVLIDKQNKFPEIKNRISKLFALGTFL